METQPTSLTWPFFMAHPIMSIASSTCDVTSESNPADERWGGVIGMTALPSVRRTTKQWQINVGLPSQTVAQH